MIIPMPNHPKSLPFILETIVPDGIVLSGGNSHVSYHGSAPERDKVDNMLIDYSIQQKCPLIGVCRGMQSIILHFGGSLCQVSNHITPAHKLEGAVCREVNSYHDWAATVCPQSLSVLARTSDGVIEAIKHEALPIFGIMWHPERETHFHEEDISLFTKILNGVKMQ
jgi:putative glutamine amidotransferase